MWDPMKKVKLHTFKSIVELKEDRGLFARMLIVTRSRPDIDRKRCISLCELTVVPRSLFSPDGKQLETLLSIQRTLKMKL